MPQSLTALLDWLLHLVDTLGVAGIFLMTLLESTFLPIPSELTMLPAGYLVQQGALPLLPTYAASIAGTLAGALVNYGLARRYGRPLMLRFGKYLLLPPHKFARVEVFFARHGEITVFTGRLIPGVRHLIAIPAGLGQMNLRRFMIFTAAGGAVWMAALLALGYVIGANQAALAQMLPQLKGAMVATVAALIGGYWLWPRLKARRTPPDR